MRRYQWIKWRRLLVRTGIVAVLAVLIRAGGPPVWNAALTVLGLLFQLLFAVVFIIIQFVALFWFLARGRTYWILPGETGATWDDYRGNPEIVENAERIVMLLKGVKDFKRMGGEAIRGLLLCGPPGTGKSYLAQVIANEAQVPFAYASAPSFQNMFFGVGNLKVMRLYGHGRPALPPASTVGRRRDRRSISLCRDDRFDPEPDIDRPGLHECPVGNRGNVTGVRKGAESMFDMKKNGRYANIIPMAELDTAEKRLSPFAVYNRLRAAAPVRYDESRGCWDVFRYEDVQRILKDPAGFSSRRALAGNETETMLTMDPPRHGQMRALVNKAFTPRVVADLEPHIVSIANDLLDAGMPDGSIDIIGDLTVPLPVVVIAELLGVPPEDRRLFKEWSDVLVKGVDENTDEAFARLAAEKGRTAAELGAYFADVIREHRRRPKEDLISLLIEAEIEGQKLNDAEIVAFSILLLAAGNETTTNLIGNGVRALTEQPDLQRTLREEPERIPAFVEETLRYYPPIQAIGRVCVADAEIGGEKLSAGQQVVSWVASANRDETKFADPDVFLGDRKPNPHLSFGSGIHFCLGAPLARLEAQIALRAVVERMEEIRLDSREPLIPIQSPFVFGVKSFPVAFRTR